MKIDKRRLLKKIIVALIILVFLLILFVGDNIKKATSFLLLSGGVIGLISKSVPNFNSPSKNIIYRIPSYDENSISGPLINIIFIL